MEDLDLLTNYLLYITITLLFRWQYSSVDLVLSMPFAVAMEDPPFLTLMLVTLRRALKCTIIPYLSYRQSNLQLNAVPAQLLIFVAPAGP